MKWILIIPLVFLQFISYSQNEKHEIVLKTDKEVYLVGETVRIEMKSRKSFRLMTDGSCSAATYPPSYIREVNGKWAEVEMGPQMCCGLPFSMPMKKMNYEKVIEIAGRYKMIVFVDRGQVVSNIFEVKDK